MLKDVGIFARAVFLKWQALLTGSLIAVAYWAAPALGFAAIRRRYYVLAALVALIVATFLAWRDEHQRAERLGDQLRETGAAEPVLRPRIECSVHANDEEVFVEIENVGDVQSTIRARGVSSPDLFGRRHFDVPWKEGVQGPRLITPGEKHSLLIARLEVNSGLFRWLVQTPRIKPGEWRKQDLTAPFAHVRAPDQGSFELTLTMIGEPQLAQLVSRTLQFRGTAVVDSETGDSFHLNGKVNRLVGLN